MYWKYFVLIVLYKCCKGKIYVVYIFFVKMKLSFYWILLLKLLMYCYFFYLESYIFKGDMF